MQNRLPVVILLTAAVVSPADGQGTFRNLNFEMANVTALPSGQYGSLTGVSSLDALPGWTVYIGSAETSHVLHNNLTSGSASVSILGPIWNNAAGATVISGNYSAVLQAGDLNGAHVSATIAQDGTVPADAKSIQMRVNAFEGYGLGVFLGSQYIPMVILGGQSAGDMLVGGDVSSYSGKLEELRLSSLTFPTGQFGSFAVDDIVFSAQQIPEPETVTLLLCGGTVLGLRRRRGLGR